MRIYKSSALNTEKEQALVKNVTQFIMSLFWKKWKRQGLRAKGMFAVWRRVFSVLNTDKALYSQTLLLKLFHKLLPKLFSWPEYVFNWKDFKNQGMSTKYFHFWGLIFSPCETTFLGLFCVVLLFRTILLALKPQRGLKTSWIHHRQYKCSCWAV